MGDYAKQEWLALYEAALTELEHARMAGRIEDTRLAIVARLEKLRRLPDLHAEERQAISDALGALRFLEREEARYDDEQRGQVLDEAFEKLKSAEAAARTSGQRNRGGLGGPTTSFVLF